MEDMLGQRDPLFEWALPLPETEYLSEDDARLGDYAAAGQDVGILLAWVNHKDPVFRVRRIRFLETYPVLLSAVARNDFPVLPPSDAINRMFPVMHLFARNADAGWQRIAVAVDRGDPVFDILAKTFQIRKTTVRILQKLRLSAIGSFWVTNEEERTLFMALDNLPEGKLPNTSREWEIMYEYATTLRMSSGHTTERIFKSLCLNGYELSYKKIVDASCGQPYILKHMNLYLDLLQRWIGEVATTATKPPNRLWLRNNRSHAADSSPDYDRTESLLNYFLSEWNAYILVRQLARLKDGMWRVYFRSLPPERVWRYSHWSPLLPEPYRPEWGSLQVRPIASWAALANEAKAMCNCLANYHVPCLLQDTYVVSVLDVETGQSLATAEMILDKGEDGQLSCVLVQCRGIRNADPTAECLQAVTEALESINRKREWLQVLWDEATNNDSLDYDVTMYEDVFSGPLARQVIQEVLGDQYQEEENRLAYIMLSYFPEMLGSPNEPRQLMTSHDGKPLHKDNHAPANAQTTHPAD